MSSIENARIRAPVVDWMGLAVRSQVTCASLIFMDGGGIVESTRRATSPRLVASEVGTDDGGLSLSVRKGTRDVGVDGGWEDDCANGWRDD